MIRVQLVRPHVDPETRWFWRHILRQRLRYSETILFSGPAPHGTMLSRPLNAPAELVIPVPIRDALATLAEARCSSEAPDDPEGHGAQEPTGEEKSAGRGPEDAVRHAAASPILEAIYEQREFHLLEHVRRCIAVRCKHPIVYPTGDVEGWRLSWCHRCRKAFAEEFVAASS